METNIKKSKREELLDKIQRSIVESGMFSENGIRIFMSMLRNVDALMDMDLVTMFLYRDGLKQHSFKAVKGFIIGLPLNELCMIAE